MATVRLIVVLLVLGAVLLLGVQNLATALPLVFFGGSTQSLPLGVWLVGAIALGAITTLVSTALLRSLGSRSGNRSAAYKYRPQSFYEPTESGAAASGRAAENPRNAPPPYSAPGPRSGGVGRSPASPSMGTSADSADDDPSWRDWTNLKSPGEWRDWESLSRASRAETASSPSRSGAAGIIDGVTTWFSSSKQRAKQQQRVDESLRDLDNDWDGLENRSYTAPGVSPVQDSLDDINQGWGSNQASDPNRDFESAQAPRRVYRDGSIYSYSYRDEADSGQVDNIYAPPDDVIGDDPGYADADYGQAEGDRPAFDNAVDDAPLGDPEMADDGVVDADYRVIVPPYNAPAEAAATSDTWVDGSDDQAGDDWDDADDALTP